MIKFRESQFRPRVQMIWTVARVAVVDAGSVDPRICPAKGTKAHRDMFGSSGKVIAVELGTRVDK